MTDGPLGAVEAAGTEAAYDQAIKNQHARGGSWLVPIAERLHAGSRPVWALARLAAGTVCANFLSISFHQRKRGAERKTR